VRRATIRPARGTSAWTVAAVAEPHAPFGQQFGQRPGEKVAVSGLVPRQVQPAHQPRPVAIRLARQRRLDLERAVAVDHPVRDAHARKDRGRAPPAFQFVLGEEDLQHAAGAVVVGDAGLGSQGLKAGAGVMRHALHPRLVAGEARPGAVAQEGREPAPLRRISARAQPKGRVRPAHPSQRLERHARRRPGAGEARTDAAGIGKARLQRGAIAALEHGHLVAVGGQVPGARDPDHSRANDEHTHPSPAQKVPG
jgi:hypothetical protein